LQIVKTRSATSRYSFIETYLSFLRFDFPNSLLDTSPLYTAGERVNQAVERVVSRRVLSEAQAQWMEHIRQALVANLSIDREDFDLLPVLSGRGGWGKADRVFDRQLEELLADLNTEVAA